MKSKYYTPTIDEFYIGFEYYSIIKNTYFHSIFGTENVDLQNIDEGIENNTIFVKHLDKDDLKELGWEKCKGNLEVFKVVGTNNNQYCKHNLSLTRLCKKITIRKRIANNYTQLFNGFIKNKSELNKLMKQLNIL